MANIGLNATCISDRPSGAKQRFLGIYGELIKILSNHNFSIHYSSDFTIPESFLAASNVVNKSSSLSSVDRLQRYLAGQVYWRQIFAREDFDIFESFHLPAIRSQGARNILTIHDVRSLYSKRNFVYSMLARFVTRRDVNSVDRVLTVSDSMKHELLNLFPSINVSVVYNGINLSDFVSESACDDEVIRLKYLLPSDFILSVGHYEERKNYPRLIDAIALLRDRRRDFRLVIVGNDSGYRDHVQRHINILRLDKFVVLLSGVSDKDLRAMYRMARLFVFPSVYEGFGIPILESMASGCPMVLNDIPVFREIAHESAVFASADNAEDLASDIDSLMCDESLRSSLTDIGSKRVVDFSFERIAVQLASIYEQDVC